MIAASADRSTAPVVGLLPEAAQLGRLPGQKTAEITSSLVGSLVGSTRWSSATGVADCPCVGCGLLVIFARTPHNNAANNAGNKTREHILGKVRGTKDQSTDQGTKYPGIFDP